MFSKVELKSPWSHVEGNVKEKWRQLTERDHASLRENSTSLNRGTRDDEKAPVFDFSTASKIDAADIQQELGKVDLRSRLTPMDLVATIFTAGFMAGMFFGLLSRIQ